TNRSPSPASKTRSGATRASAQVATIAIGCWPCSCASRRCRLTSPSGLPSPRKRRGPACRRRRAVGGGSAGGGGAAAAAAAAGGCRGHGAHGQPLHLAGGEAAARGHDAEPAVALQLLQRRAAAQHLDCRALRVLGLGAVRELRAAELLVERCADRGLEPLQQ